LEAPIKYIGDNMENKESFDELYTRIYNENFKELEHRRCTDTSTLKTLLIIVVMLIVGLIGMGIMLGFDIKDISKVNSDAFIPIVMAVALSPLVIIILISLVYQKFKNTKEGKLNDKESYRSVFKKKIVKPILDSVLNDCNYDYTDGLTKEEYNLGEWEKYDSYRSKDKISTSINNLNLVMSQVHTQERRKDSPTQFYDMFYGIAGFVKLPKDIGCYVKVVNNEYNLFGTSYEKVEMDMVEFEKIFDIKTDDKVKIMQIFTIDVMTNIIELIKTNKVKFELYINNDMMNIRFHTGEVFEPNIYGKAMQYEMLKRYYNIVNGIKNTTKYISNVIINVDI